MSTRATEGPKQSSMAPCLADNFDMYHPVFARHRHHPKSGPIHADPRENFAATGPTSVGIAPHIDIGQAWGKFGRNRPNWSTPADKMPPQTTCGRDSTALGAQCWPDLGDIGLHPEKMCVCVCLVPKRSSNDQAHTAEGTTVQVLPSANSGAACPV